MKRTVLVYTILFSLSWVGFVGCAKEQSIDLSKISHRVFVDWVFRTSPTAEPFNEDSTIFVEYYKRSTTTLVDSLKIKDGIWMSLSYTGYNTGGTSFITRDSTVSHIAGSWQNSTHWISSFSQYNSNGDLILSRGVLDVLPSLNTGDSLRIYASTNLGYSIDALMNIGYRGETPNYIDAPYYIDLFIGNTVVNPSMNQKIIIDNYAKVEWGLNPQDTLFKDIYGHFIGDRKPTGALIGSDSTVYLYYKEQFLDTFFIRTNNDSIAREYDRYINDIDFSYDIESFEPNGSNTTERELPPIVDSIVKLMRVGETMEVLIPSNYSHLGDIGDMRSQPQINPYTPTLYTLFVVPKEED